MSEFDAVKAMLESDPQLVGRVVDTAVKDDGDVVRGTYLVLFGAGPESLDDDRYGSVPRPDSDAAFSLPVRAVSGDPEGVRLLYARVQALVGSKPVVVGRRCDPVTVRFDQVKADTSVSPPLYFMDMWVEFTSRRA